jgi:hypothetical protein
LSSGTTLQKPRGRGRQRSAATLGRRPFGKLRHGDVALFVYNAGKEGCREATPASSDGRRHGREGGETPGETTIAPKSAGFARISV